MPGGRRGKDYRNRFEEVVVGEQLILALKSWTEENRDWEIVWDQVPEASWNAAIVQCARLVSQAIQETQHSDGEGDEQRE